MIIPQVTFTTNTEFVVGTRTDLPNQHRYRYYQAKTMKTIDAAVNFFLGWSDWFKIGWWDRFKTERTTVRVGEDEIDVFMKKHEITMLKREVPNVRAAVRGTPLSLSSTSSPTVTHIPTSIPIDFCTTCEKELVAFMNFLYPDGSPAYSIQDLREGEHGFSFLPVASTKQQLVNYIANKCILQIFRQSETWQAVVPLLRELATKLNVDVAELFFVRPEGDEKYETLHLGEILPSEKAQGRMIDNVREMRLNQITQVPSILGLLINAGLADTEFIMTAIIRNPHAYQYIPKEFTLKVGEKTIPRNHGYFIYSLILKGADPKALVNALPDDENFDLDKKGVVGKKDPLFEKVVENGKRDREKRDREIDASEWSEV